MRSKAGLLVGAWLFAGVAWACGSGTGACIRMSDCEAPFQCVEGTCRSDEVLGDPRGAASDASASEQ